MSYSFAALCEFVIVSLLLYELNVCKFVSSVRYSLNAVVFSFIAVFLAQLLLNVG